MMVGAKRNKLLDMAQGEYLCFVDDDDRVFGDYLEKILEALKTKPDVVGITILWTDQIFEAIRLLVRSLEYNDVHWMPSMTLGGQLGCGRPAHLNPTKSSIAKSERFNEKLTAGEDSDWSSRVVGKLKTCVPIDLPIYHYNFQKEGTLTQRPNAKGKLLPPLPPNHQRVMRDGKIVELDERGLIVEKHDKETV
jgi:glycosyltransferase involved in cell wall biosynthesis